MRDGVVASLLVVTILAGVGAGYLVGNANEHIITSVSIIPTDTIYTILTASTTTRTVASYTPIVTAGCDVPSDLYLPLFAPATANSSETGQLAAAMLPSSNATLFVGYCPYQTEGPVTLSPSVNTMSCFSGSGGGGCTGEPAKDLKITAVPNQTVFENQSLTVVAYHISANENSTGYYAIGIPNSCPSVGLAVGHPANQLTHANFPWMGMIPCPLTFGGVMSITGANMTYVALG